MRAFRWHGPGAAPILESVDVPVPRGPQVLVQVEAAGLCHSDLNVLDSTPLWPDALPFTLGHEIAGRIAATGDRVTSHEIGQRVAVYGPWGCGTCDRCHAGRDNYCDNRGRLGWAGAGLGRDGGMADSVLVPDERLLVPLGGLDPLDAAPLTDAGLTSYSAIAPLIDELGEASSAVVIGAGGLGHIAIQILRACTPSQVIAVDVRPPALALASSCGAHHALPADADAAPAIRRITTRHGADVVLDFVGNPASVALATGVLRSAGRIVLVGSGGGEITVKKFGSLPQGASVSMPFWGSRPELVALLQLAGTGAIKVHRTAYPLSAAPRAIADLRAGRIEGRAVLVPDGAAGG